MQDAIGELMTATSEDDVAARVLPPMASMVGARGIALESTDGTPIGTYGSLDEGHGDVAQWEFPFGRLVVRTSTLRAVLRRRGAEAAARARLADRARARPGAPLRAGARRPRGAASGPTSSRASSSRSPRTSSGRRSARSTGSRRRSPSGATELAPEQLEELQSIAHDADPAAARARGAAARPLATGRRGRRDPAAARAGPRPARGDRRLGLAARVGADRARGRSVARGRARR